MNGLPETIVYHGPTVSDRLRELGLTVEGLVEAVRQGEMAAAEATRHDPPTAGGYDRWRYTVRSLRDTYCPTGEWVAREENGLPLLESEDKARVVIVRPGDEGVGDPSMVPRLRRAPGEAISNRTKTNHLAQLPLSASWFNQQLPKSQGPQTWFLMTAKKGDIIYAELSLGYGDIGPGGSPSWMERIILPTTLLGEPPPSATQRPEAEDVDVQVSRKR